MKIVIFGLTVSSSWGNGHATLWRGLIRALASLGHRVVFFERDVPFYAENRDLTELAAGRLVLYRDWAAIRAEAAAELTDADAGIVTSYCPDAIAAGDLLRQAGRPSAIFYDLDTPVTLARLAGGESVGYIGPRALRDYDLVLSYTGGAALAALRDRLGAKRVEPLYGHVDPDLHRRAAPAPHYGADLSYLGTYAADRQPALERLFIEPAARLPQRRFVIGGAQYPAEFPWSANIHFVRHLPPAEHPAFFSSCRLTLNVTRQAMAAMGYCPSGRLFEAAACGCALLSDDWPGIEAFFQPESEILLARSGADTAAALDRSDAELRRIGEAAQARTHAQHTSIARALELERLIDAARARPGATPAQPVEA